MKTLLAIGALPHLFLFLILAALGQNEPRTPSFLETPTVAGSASRPIRLMDLLTLRDVGGVRVSPDGEYVAFQVRQAVFETNTYRAAWFVSRTTPGRQPVNVGDAGDPRWFTANSGAYIGTWMVSQPEWSPDGQSIAFLALKNGEVQVWRSRRDGTLQEQLTRNASNIAWPGRTTAQKSSLP